MQGQLSIYQGYLEGGTPFTESTPILQESNMIVDGMKEHIVDMLTRIPAPSSVSASVSASYNVSNFTVQALTLSPNRSAFDRVHGLAGLSGTVRTGTATNIFRDLDPSDGTVWAYNSDIPNYLMSGVNVSGGISPNGQLLNPMFSEVDTRIINGKFRNYSLDKTLPSVHMNTVLSLYELNGWDIESYLRYDASASEFLDTVRHGSCSRYGMSEVSGIFSSLSGTALSSTYASADDGILFIRAFQPNGVAHGYPDTSGMVALRQNFNVRTPEILKEASVDGTDNVLAEVAAQFSSLSGGANSRIMVNVRNETIGQYYYFSAEAHGARNSWGVIGAPLVLNAVAGTSGTMSDFINIPSSAVNDTFTLEFKFYCHDATDVFKCYFWNAGVNLLEGWSWGNIFSGQGLHRVWDNAYRDPALFIGADNSVSGDPADVPLSSTTYLAQPFSMEPLKKYSVIPAFSGTAALTAGSDIVDIAIVKRFSSDTSSLGGYDYLSTSASFALQETRLPANYAFSPEYPVTSPPSSIDLQAATVRPSDLCLQISAESTVSGSFLLPRNNRALLSGDILRSFANGVKATDHLKIYLRTEERGPDGEQRWFNFTTGDWEVGRPSASSGEDTLEYISFDSSTLNGPGYQSFNPPEIAVNTLIGIIPPSPLEGDPVELVVLVENKTATVWEGDAGYWTTPQPGFIKNIRVNSTPKTLAQDTQEVYKFKSTIPTACWQTLTYSGQNILSGLTTAAIIGSNTESTVATLNTLGTYPIESMYAASASTHASDSEYRVYVMQSKATAPPTGEAYKLNLINIVDDSLVVATKQPPADTLTSESYVNTQRFDFVNQPYLEWTDNNNVYPPTSLVHPGGCTQSASPALAGNLNQSNHSLILASISDPGGGLQPTCQLSYIENLGDIVLPTSATQRSFTFNYNQLNNGSDTDLRWRACATTKNKDVVWWDATTSGWDKYNTSAIPNNEYESQLGRGGSTLIKTALSTRYDITSELFDEDTKIKTSIFSFGWDAGDVTTILNWKFYTNGPYPELDMPEFPKPTQTTLQTPSSPYAELGHYSNQIALSASLPDVSIDRALGNINWASSAGLWVSGVETQSMLNAYDVINSDGYVLFGYNGPIELGSRPAYPYYINGLNAASSTSSMTYTLDVSSGALNWFQHQGGVGAIGLHTFNVSETYKKLKANGFAISAIYDVDGADADSLYNLTDVTRNPVFKMAAKKVFRTPLSFDTAANRFIRLIWEIRFI